ncbi:hypothetical protein LC608_14240 [Nostoc sp. XA010]|uniref:hypothetical protein n=1 Tax=Nostoc sp. XA010 TaxID=2780407 RepID=UPI001E5798B4|nr:hypothetical protein [Nostoc sp. XA010]MCC5658128.1 hypothetical protein [Nostoc sp. XA010]
MIRRIALATGLSLLSALTFASTASAETKTQDILFSGTVPATCTFSNVQDGVLAQGSPGDSWVEGAAGIIGSTTGKPGTATLKCTSASSLSTGVPLQTAAPAGFNAPIKQSIVSDGTNYTSTSSGDPFDSGLWGQSNAPLDIPAATDVALTIGMIAGDNTGGVPVPAGTYSYTVTLTATNL